MTERRWKRKRKKIEPTMPLLACSWLFVILLNFVPEEVGGASIQDYEDFDYRVAGEPRTRRQVNAVSKRSGILPELMREEWKEASVSHVGSSKDNVDTIHHHFIMGNSNSQPNPKVTTPPPPMSANEGLNQILEKLDNADDESLDNFLDWDKEYNDLLSELDSIDLASLDGLVVTKTRTRVFRPFSLSTPPPPTHHHHYHIFTEGGSNGPPPKVRGFVSDRIGEARVDLTETLASESKAKITRKRFTFKFAGDEPEERGNHVHHLHVHTGIRKSKEKGQSKEGDVTNRTIVVSTSSTTSLPATGASSSITSVTTTNSNFGESVPATIKAVTSSLPSTNASAIMATTGAETVVNETVFGNGTKSDDLDEVILFEAPIATSLNQNATSNDKALSGNRVEDAQLKKIKVLTVDDPPATNPPDVIIFEQQHMTEKPNNNGTSVSTTSIPTSTSVAPLMSTSPMPTMVSTITTEFLSTAAVTVLTTIVTITTTTLSSTPTAAAATSAPTHAISILNSSAGVGEPSLETNDLVSLSSTITATTTATTIQTTNSINSTREETQTNVTLSGKSGVALVVGGTYANKSGILALHQLTPAKSCSMPEKFNLPMARIEHSVVMLDKYLTVCGGVDINGSNVTDEILSDSCNLMDPDGGSWYQLPSMPAALAGAASVSSGNKFYMLGGRTKEGPSSKVFVFDQLSKQWFEGVGLSTARYGACAVIKNGVVVVTGGANISGGFLSSVEMYDTRTGEGWVALPNMTLPRAMHGCTIANKGDLVVENSTAEEEDFLLVAGGSGNSNETSTSVEALSFGQSQSGWVQIRPMRSSRCCWPQMGTIDNKISVLFGNEGDTNSAGSSEVWLKSLGNWAAGLEHWRMSSHLGSRVLLLEENVIEDC